MAYGLCTLPLFQNVDCVAVSSGEEDAELPGDSFAYEVPVYVSEDMQHIVQSCNAFSSAPIGPIYKHIPQKLQKLLPLAFLHYYIIATHHDADELVKLFKIHQEPMPNVIIRKFASRMYPEVKFESSSNAGAVELLQIQNPTIGNVLIDFFKAHQFGMLHCV